VLVSAVGIALWAVVLAGGATIVLAATAPTASAACVQDLELYPPDCLWKGCIVEDDNPPPDYDVHLENCHPSLGP